MAALHAAAFNDERHWSAVEFADLLKNNHVDAYTQAHGMALTSTAGGDTELLILAVHPDQRRRGIARALTLQWLDSVGDRADIAFLEVAADNLAALTLYTDLGFGIIGRRLAYYTRESGPAVDALIMQQALPHGQGPDSAPFPPESS